MIEMSQLQRSSDMGKQRLLGDGICEVLQGSEVKTFKSDLDRIWADGYRKSFYSNPHTELASKSSATSIARPPHKTSAEIIKIPCATDYESSSEGEDDKEEINPNKSLDTSQSESPNGNPTGNSSEKIQINSQYSEDEGPPEGMDRRIYAIQQSFAKATDHFLQITVPKQLQRRGSDVTRKSAVSNVPEASLTNTNEDSKSCGTDSAVYKLRYSNATEGSIYSHSLNVRDLRVTK